MRGLPASKCCCFLLLLFLCNAGFSQSLKQEKMELLHFLVGEWIGTSKIYENGVVTKQCAARYPAEYKDGQLIVWRNEESRFFFGSTDEGGFQEYGEKLIDGEWVRTFEDTFTNTQ